MKRINLNYWITAIAIGSLLNTSLFVLLPKLGKTEPPKAPSIIKVEFMAWQQPRKKQPTPPKNKPKLKPKPKPKLEKPKPKLAPPPKSLPKKKPALTEEPTPIEKPPIPEPAIKEEPTEEILPVPAPIFELTSMPRMIHRETPVYPPEMRAQGKEATVKLEVLLDVNGQVKKVTIKKSGGSLFDQAAINAIKSSTFMPGNINGKPVAVLMRIPVKFRLR